MATALQRYRWLASATIDAAVDRAAFSDASAASARRLAAARLTVMSSVTGICTVVGARCKRTSIGVRSSAGGISGAAGAAAGGAGERSGGSCSASRLRPSVCGAGGRQSSRGATHQAFPPCGSPSAPQPPSRKHAARRAPASTSSPAAPFRRARWPPRRWRQQRRGVRPVAPRGVESQLQVVVTFIKMRV